MERHRPDVLVLLGGLISIAVAAVGLTDRILIDVTDLRLLGPALLVLLGVAMVLTAARGRRDEVARDGSATSQPELADDAGERGRPDG